MIEVEGLAKRFGDRVAVEGVSFQVAAGEVFGLLGPNGGGKTTTMRLIAGLLRPTAGSARVDGHDLLAEPDARRHLGLLTEGPGLYERISARANLVFFARLYDVPEREVQARVDEAFALFGLLDRADDKAGGYSKGMRQRLALARAVLHRPKALLLDEPTSGLDPEAAAQVRDTIALLASQGVAVLVSTHNLAEAERLCRRVAIVKNRLLSIVDDTASDTERVEVRAGRLPAQAAATIGQMAGVERAQLEGDALELRVRKGTEAVADVVAWLVHQGARVQAVTPLRRALEEQYLSLVGARVLADDAGAVG